jgi:hypothetical protein
MDPITLSILLGGGGQLLSGILGELGSAGDKREQMRLLQQTLADYEGLSLPELQELQAEQLGPSRFDAIKTDPAARQAQYDALSSLEDIIRSGGLTLEDRANMGRINADVARNESAGRARIAADMTARGQYGGGQQLAMQLANQQAAANRGARAGLDTAAMAQRRGMDATMARGRMGGELRGQDFGEQAQRAQAADLVSRWNADSRAGAARYNAMLPQQQFANQMAITQGKAQARGAKAGQHARQADDTRALWGGLGKGAQAAGTGVSNQLSYDDWLKRRAGGG